MDAVSQALSELDSQDTLSVIEGLNDPQKEAVCAPLSNMLVIAGAGTGKTRVLVSRIAWLIGHYQISPRNILAVTFTNKAANEMRERIARYSGRDVVRQLWASTFHSICLRLLRSYPEQAGFKPNFTILDTDSQNSLVKRIMKAKGIEDKELKPSYVVSKISSLKEKGIRAEEYRKKTYSRYEDPNHGAISSIYSAYEETCKNENTADFSELLLRTVELLEKDPQIRELQHKRFKEILVDEFQDTNSIQYKFLKLMSGDNAHVMVVGDDDQSIYGWRGADYTNMHHFLEDYPNVSKILLYLNYRSYQKILDMANTLISDNKGRLIEKVLRGNSGQGEDVSILNCSDSSCESRTVASQIASLYSQGVNYRDIAILYRNNYLSLGFEQSLSSLKIPYVIYGGQRFFERAEILDALAYLRVIINDADDTAALRIINVPARKIGPKVVDDLRAICLERNCSIYQALHLLDTYVNQDGDDRNLIALHKKIKDFYQMIESFKKLKDKLPLHDFVGTVIRNSGLEDLYKQKDLKEGKAGEDHSRVSNLGVLVSNVREFVEAAGKADNNENGELQEDPLLTYLSNITLTSTSELDEDGSAQSSAADAVNIMTIHASKGLEFSHVFLVGFEKGILPSEKTFESSSDHALEEERRLAYVGITRAKQSLTISYAQRRSLFGKVITSGASDFLRAVVRSYSGDAQKNKPYAIKTVSGYQR
ncbi:MAG: ATP-dependent helicase [Succinivibrio sp.]